MRKRGGATPFRDPTYNLAVGGNPGLKTYFMIFQEFISNKTSQAWGEVIGTVKSLAPKGCKADLFLGNKDEQGNYTKQHAQLIITSADKKKYFIMLSVKLTEQVRKPGNKLKAEHLVWFPVLKGTNKAGEERLTISLPTNDGISIDEVEEFNPQAEYVAA